MRTGIFAYLWSRTKGLVANWQSTILGLTSKARVIGFASIVPNNTPAEFVKTQLDIILLDMKPTAAISEALKSAKARVKFDGFIPPYEINRVKVYGARGKIIDMYMLQCVPKHQEVFSHIVKRLGKTTKLAGLTAAI
jgi:hypothetical protein